MGRLPFRQCDIDLDSGRVRAATNNKAHFTIGGLCEGPKVDAFYGAGAFAEFPQRNTDLYREGLLIKCGAVF